jgi:tyrosyl-tRNA synthetase
VLPEDMPEISLQAPAAGLALTQLLKQAGLVPSVSEANRMIEQGGVKVDGDRVSERSLVLAKGKTCVVQVGKRKVARVTIA